MNTLKKYRRFAIAGLGLLFLFWAPFVSAQTYPDRPITIYCAYTADTTDMTARSLAEGVEKILGVPVVVENKPGGGSTVCAGLLATKKPDGYTLGVISTGALRLLPHLMKISYNPMKDFTLLMQYSRFLGGLCVLSESPMKTVDDFIAYAKAHPNLSYGSPGMYSQQNLAVELFAQCKGLKFKHVPFKSGAETSTALLGKHIDFAAGSGTHIRYVKQGAFRELLVYNSNKRNQYNPKVPTLEEIGCQDFPANAMLLVGPKGLPEPIAKKLGETFKKVADSAGFQEKLVSLDLPYDYKGQAQLEKEIPQLYEAGKNLLEKMGAKKAE
jgi:tripartite-type tricarboxylate transporter receptor subunit TctC